MYIDGTPVTDIFEVPVDCKLLLLMIDDDSKE